MGIYKYIYAHICNYGNYNSITEEKYKKEDRGAKIKSKGIYKLCN
jgi:hypothetical protein